MVMIKTKQSKCKHNNNIDNPNTTTLLCVLLLLVVFFTEQGCGEKIISNVQPLSAPSAPFTSVASFPSGPKPSIYVPVSLSFHLSLSVSHCLPPSLEEAKAADLQPPSCWCQLNKPVSFMQYAEENRQPLTTEPASQERAATALKDTISLTFIRRETCETAYASKTK